MATDAELKRAKLELLELQRQVLERDKSVFENNDNAPGKIKGGARMALQGATLGFADEIGAAAAAGARSLVSNDSFGDVYDDTLFNLKREREAFRRKYPVLSFGSELSGGAAQGAGVIKGLSGIGAIRNAPKIPVLAGGGAIEGGIYGAGASDPGNRLSGAGQGAVLGGVLSPAVALAGAAGAGLVRPIVRKLGEALAQTNTDKARRLVRRALEQDDITPQEAEMLLQGMGGRGTIADLGENTTGLARTVATIPGRGAANARRFLDERQLTQQQTLRQAARRATGANDFDSGVIDIINEAESAAGPLYREAYSHSVDVTSVMDDLMLRPAMKRAKNKAQAILRNEGFDPAISNDLTDVRYIDALKKALDDDISVAVRKGAKNQARVLSGIKEELLGEVDAQVPVYAEARRKFAGEAAIRDAAGLGRTVLNRGVDPDDIAEAVARMGGSELQAFRHGLLRRLTDDLSNTKETINAAKKLAETPKIREMLRIAFPDQDALDDFLRSARSESAFSQTRNEVLGGSKTARTQAGARDAADEAGLSGTLLSVLTGDSAAPMRSIRNAVFRQDISPDVAEEVSKLLFDPNIIPRNLRQNPVVSAFDFPRVPDPVFRGMAIGATPAAANILLGLDSIRNTMPFRD